MATWNAPSGGGIDQAQAQAASEAALTAYSAARQVDVAISEGNVLSAINPPGLTRDRVTLEFGDSIIKLGSPGHHLEIYCVTFSSLGTVGGAYTIGYSDNDEGNFVALANKRPVGGLLADGSNVGGLNSNSWQRPQYVLPDGKAFAATSEGEVDVEFWYVDVIG